MTSDVTVQQITAILPALLSPDAVLADHYFVPNPSGTGLSPIWDMRATKRFQGNQNAFMLGKSFGSVASPVDPSLNINWLRVAKVSGDAADEVYRIDTLGGQPPTSVSFPSHQFRECGSLMVILRYSALPVRPRISASDTLPSIGSLGDHCSSDLRHRSESLIPHWWRARGIYPPVFEVSLSLVTYRTLQVGRFYSCHITCMLHNTFLAGEISPSLLPIISTSQIRLNAQVRPAISASAIATSFLPFSLPPPSTSRHPRWAQPP